MRSSSPGVLDLAQVLHQVARRHQLHAVGRLVGELGALAHAHVGVLEARPALQALGQVGGHVAAQRELLEAAHLLGRLLDVTEVGEEQALVGTDDAGAVGAGEAREVAHVDHLR